MNQDQEDQRLSGQHCRLKQDLAFFDFTLTGDFWILTHFVELIMVKQII